MALDDPYSGLADTAEAGFIKAIDQPPGMVDQAVAKTQLDQANVASQNLANARYGQMTPSVLANSQQQALQEGQKSQLGALNVENTTQAQPLTSMATWEARLAQAAASINPDDPGAAQKWGNLVAKETAAGSPIADQWQTYTPNNMARITAAYSPGTSPLAQYNAVSNPAPGAPTAGSNDVVSAFSQNPQMAAAAVPKLSSMIGSFDRALSSIDPNGTWDREALATNHPDQVGRFSNVPPAQAVAEMRQMRAELQSYYHTAVDVVNRAQLGIPQQAPPVAFEKLGQNESLIVTKRNPDGSVSTSVGVPAVGEWKVPSYVSGANGEAVEQNTASGASRALPGTSARENTYQTKLDAATAAGLSPADALSVANGQKNLSDSQLSVAADRNVQAQIDAQLQGNPGTAPPTPAQRAALVAAEVSNLKALSGSPSSSGAAKPAQSAPPPPDRIASVLKANPGLAIPFQTPRGPEVWKWVNGQPVLIHTKGQ